MCRWVAYAGPEIYLEDLIFHQEHSIVSQSLAANQSAWVTNGDGFGVAWYTQRTTPVRNPEYLDSQSRITWTVKRQHLDTSPAHLDS